MVKPTLRKSKLSGRSLTTPAAKSSSTAPKRSVNDVLGRTDKTTIPPADDRTHADDQPTLSTDMEPNKLATAIQDIQMHDADDPPASKRGSNDIADDLDDNLTNASIAKPVNERGKSGSPPDKRSRAHPVSLISPPNDEGEATTTPNAPPLNLADDDNTTAPTETRTGFTYAKAVVGFTTHDEVRAERTDTDGSVKSVTTKSLARVFSAALARKHTLFLKIMFPTTPSKSDPTKTARAQLMNYIIMLQEVDETALLYRWEQKSATEGDACLKPAALPTSLTGLQSFAHQFRPNTDGGDC